MNSTTLVTFRYQAPHNVARVDLLGSWDNFAKPYPMQWDRSVSSKNWKGCHSFSDIVCDGDIVAMDGTTRQGGLQMGGTYWYYYRIDDATECHDPTIESTRGCPFLPGQEVNVLEVPIQRDLTFCDSTTALPNVFTLDPAAKFASPKRSTSPIIKPRLPIRAAVKRASSLKESFLGSTVPTFLLARSRSISSRRCLTAPATTKMTAIHAEIRPFTKNDVKDLQSDWEILADSTFEPLPTSPLLPHETYHKSSGLDDNMINLGLGIDQLDLDDYRCTSSKAEAANDTTPCQDYTTFISQSPTSRSTRTSGVFSLLSDSAIGSPMSTNRHSFFNAQPQTPSLPSFDSFVLEPLQFNFPSLGSIADMTIDVSSAQQETSLYLQPEKDYSSANTLRLTHTPLKEFNHAAKLSPLEKLDLVESWRNGESPSTVPEADPSTLQELINDLGYLSSMIQ